MLKNLTLWKAGLPLTGILLCTTLGFKTYAQDEKAGFPDLTKTGSISVEMHAAGTGDVLPGGSLTLYKAADYAWDGNGYTFRYTDEFIGFVKDEYYFDFGRLNDWMAQEMAIYAEEKGIEGTTKLIGDDGRAAFPALDTGLYVVDQKEAPESYYPVCPFFVTVPILDTATDTYVYDVDASPKTRPYEAAEPETEPEPEPTEPEPTEPEPTEPTPTEPVPSEPEHDKPAQTEPAPGEPDENESEPPETRPEISTPSNTETNGTMEGTGSGRPGNTASHRTSGEGDGDGVIGTVQVTDLEEAQQSEAEIGPLAETGHRRNILAGTALFIVSGIMLALAVRVRERR